MKDQGIKKLTSEQVERLEVVVAEMAKRGNPFGQAIQKALLAKTPSEKRATLAGSYTQMYAMMLAMQMAVISKVNPKTVESRLSDGEEA